MEKRLFLRRQLPSTVSFWHFVQPLKEGLELFASEILNGEVIAHQGKAHELVRVSERIMNHSGTQTRPKRTFPGVFCAGKRRTLGKFALSAEHS
jgi:hypothetical protein